MKVSWIKQDDGGSPIKQYLLSYRPVSMLGYEVTSYSIVPQSVTCLIIDQLVMYQSSFPVSYIILVHVQYMFSSKYYIKGLLYSYCLSCFWSDFTDCYVANTHTDYLSISVSVCKQKHQTNWKTVVRVPNGGEFYVLRGLDWNTEYEVSVVAENQQGRSEPGTLFFRTSAEPTAIPGTIHFDPFSLIPTLSLSPCQSAQPAATKP